jgi:hypothetical protein
VLVGDGLSREQFTALWHDAMAAAPDPAERARLILELGRVTIRESDALDPMMIAVVENRDRPFIMVPLPEAPTRDQEPVRGAARERLAELGASEVYVLMLLAAKVTGGHPARLLVCWGESQDRSEVVWMQPMRWVQGVREEAAVVRAPAPEQTEISKRCRGLLVPVH